MRTSLKAADPGPGQQVTISLRVPAELKARLEQVATIHDRNLSQESERRLRRSFSPEEIFEDFVELLRREAKRRPVNSASAYIEIALREVYGAEIGVLGVKFLDNLAWARQGVRAAREDDDVQAIKTAVAEIEAVRRQDAVAISKLPRREAKR